MRKMSTILMSIVIASMLMLGSAYAAGKDVYIAVISKGFQHEFWQTVKLGSDTASEELGVKSTFEGPANESMIAEQIDMVENAITKKATAILLAALDTEALIPVVEKAKSKGIPVVMFDSNVNSDIPLSFVATDNKAAGGVAAEQLGKQLGGKGVVGIVAHNAGTSTAQQRRDGFIEKMKEMYPDIKLLEPVYSDGDHQKAMDKSTDMMQSNPNLAAIYATNEGSAIGVATAVDAKGKGGKVKVVGFDSSEAEIAFLKSGVVQGFVVQNPFNMGYLGVKALYDVLEGKTIDSRIDTGATYVTLENLESEKVQKLLNPLGK